ncbi:MAG TPA: hypothetical protein VK012_05615 [Gemmatimonadales bacterium]|nr:hypothetical protein [Gemmatimonadales bacterium]
MSKLAGVLMQLRARAKARPGEWQERDLVNGLRLAWRVKRIEGVDMDQIALKREGVMPSWVEVRTVVKNAPVSLTCVSKTIHPDRFLILLTMKEQSCRGCGNALDVTARMKGREHCSKCPGPGEALCWKCRGVIPAASRRGSKHVCGDCLTKIEMSERRQRERERERAGTV